MKEHVYPAEFVEVMDNGNILFTVDLGFNIQNTRPFRLYSGDKLLYEPAWDAIESWLEAAEAIMIKSVRPKPGQYYADITFQREFRWYNMLHLLGEEGFLWKGLAHASK